MNWKRIRTTAWWEYSRRVRERGFIVSILLTPMLMIAFSVVPSYLLMQEPEKTEAVGVIDGTGHLLQPMKSYVEAKWKLADGSPRYLLVDQLAAGADIDAAIRTGDSISLRETTIGTMVISDSAGVVVGVYRSPNATNIQLVERFRKVLEKITTESRLLRAGIDTAIYNRARAEIELTTVKVTKEGASESSEFVATFLLAIGGTMLLMFLVMTTGQSLVRSLVEEKSNRVIDLLVSSTTPSELMWGKLIGLSGLGLTQIGAWGFIAVGITSAIALPAGATTTLRSLYDVLPFIAAYVVLGYVLYSAIFIAVGSLVNTEQEAQLASTYLVLLLVMPMAFAVAVMQSPDAPYVKVVSFIPFVTPSMMMIRLTTKAPPMWEIVASLALLATTTVLLVWIAGRVFRTAILLYGKRPTLREIGRWVRG